MLFNKLLPDLFLYFVSHIFLTKVCSFINLAFRLPASTIFFFKSSRFLITLIFYILTFKILWRTKNCIVIFLTKMSRIALLLNLGNYLRLSRSLCYLLKGNYNFFRRNLMFINTNRNEIQNAGVIPYHRSCTLIF